LKPLRRRGKNLVVGTTGRYSRSWSRVQALLVEKSQIGFFFTARTFRFGIQPLFRGGGTAAGILQHQYLGHIFWSAHTRQKKKDSPWVNGGNAAKDFRDDFGIRR